MNDALRDPIVIGNRYGYSTSSSGFISVTIGTAVRITGKDQLKVTLEDLTTNRYLYGGPEPCTPWEGQEPPKHVSVYAVHLFPIRRDTE